MYVRGAGGIRIDGPAADSDLVGADSEEAVQTAEGGDGNIDGTAAQQRVAAVPHVDTVGADAVLPRGDIRQRQSIAVVGTEPRIDRAHVGTVAVGGKSRDGQPIQIYVHIDGLDDI